MTCDVTDGVLSTCDGCPSGALDLSSEASITAIGHVAFQGCSSLASVAFPDALQTIESYAFGQCSSLASVDLSNTAVTTIGSEAFLGCSSLASVVFPDALHTIEMGAFLGCSSLASVVFPDALHTIGEYAFADCSDLKALIFLRTSPMSQVGEGVFEWVMPTNVFYAGAKLELVGGILPCSPTLEAPCVESASKSDLELLQDLQQSC